MATTILVNEFVFVIDTGKVWKLDKIDKTVTLYANETQYNADNPVGTLALGELHEVARQFQLLKEPGWV